MTLPTPARLCRPASLLFLLLFAQLIHAQLHYTLAYTDSSGSKLRITIEPDTVLATPMSFVMPRSIPGNYGIVKYDLFVEHLTATGADGSTRRFEKSAYGAPRWRCADSNFKIKSISYDINLAKMDEDIHAASDKSVARSAFVGLLNYSVLGWIEGHDRQPVRCSVANTMAYNGQMVKVLHHMAHAFIPLRCYGDTYRPYVMEIPPVIHNIWFNEGFMWYIVYDTLKQKEWLDYFKYVTYNGSPAIRSMTLQQLSEVASTQYAEDFRLGTAVYSRGALMAYDIDEYVKGQTAGKSSMRTVYRYLYEWSQRTHRAFTMQEFPGLIKTATGVDISTIYNKWQNPVD